jgi:alkanesulfonate monooxygenase SsuD/methylene tetrahydromethanopterin reductase-like flavin-dependent oxidoreductase (luciferase family)
VARQAGWEAPPEHFILTRHIFVGDSDEEARRMAEPALRYFFTLSARGFNEAVNERAADRKKLNAALNSAQSFSYFRPENRPRIDFSTLSWEELVETGYVIAGSPGTVAKQLRGQMEAVGAGHFMGMFHIGNLEHGQVVRSLERFASEVAPAVAQAPGGAS